MAAIKETDIHGLEYLYDVLSGSEIIRAFLSIKNILGKNGDASMGAADQKSADPRKIWYCDFCSEGPCELKTPNGNTPNCPYKELSETDFRLMRDAVPIEEILEEINGNEQLKNSPGSQNTGADGKPIDTSTYSVPIIRDGGVLLKFLADHADKKCGDITNPKCYECGERVRFYRRILDTEYYIQEKYVALDLECGIVRIVHPKCKTGGDAQK